METIDIKEASTTELQALGYRLIGQLDMTRQSLNVVNEELALRAKSENNVVPEQAATVEVAPETVTFDTETPTAI